MLQKTVRFDQAFGVPGEIIYDGPVRAQPGMVVSASATNNVFGRVFSRLLGVDTWRAGDPDGLGVEHAIMANPKEAVSSGTPVGGTLAPTLAVPNNTTYPMLTMGFVTVYTLTAAQRGYDVRYDILTGEIKCVPAATVDATIAKLSNAKVTRFPQPTVPGPVVIALTEPN